METVAAADLAGDVIVGRDQPLRQIRAVLSQAEAGQRSVVLVTGPAGIGKSTLARVAVSGVRIVGWGTCVDDEAAPGYWPWTRALDGIAAEIGGDRAADAAGEDARLLARIGRSFAPASPPVDLSQRDRLSLMDAVSRWLQRVAAVDGPAVVVLDDLQWADESSLALFEFVARDASPAAVCLVGCYRHDELSAPARDRLARVGLAATSVDLTGLDPQAVAALAESIAGPLSAAAVQDLYRRGGGHPVFTRELARLVAAGEDRRVPLAVRDAIESRFRRLPAEVQQVLEVLAVAAGPLPVDLVAAVAAELPAEAVPTALDRAEDAGIVVAEDHRTARFAHDLYRETVASTVSAARGAELHRRIGAALEERAARGDEVSAAELAHHFTAALPLTEAHRAARWALAAADRDRERLAFGEAAGHLRRWRAAVAGAEGAVDERLRVELLLAEADALGRAGAAIDARGLLRAARDACKAIGMPDLLARVALAVTDLGGRFAARRDDVIQEVEEALAAVAGSDLELEARLTATLARELQHSVVNDRPRAGPLSERALALGRAAGDPSTLVKCLLARHDVLWTPGAATSRIEIATEIVATAERMGDHERRAEGCLLLANALLETGSPAFEPALDACLEILGQLAQPRHRYIAHTRRAALLLLRGELDAAEAAIDEAAALGQRIREPDAENVRMSQRLEWVRARGAADELAAFSAAALAHWTGAPVHAHAVAAGFLARAGDLESARRHVTVVHDLGSWRTERSYLWSVLVRELSVAAMALDDRELSAQLLSDLAPIAGTCGVNGAVVAFAGSHAHTAGLLANHLRDPEHGGLWLEEAAGVYRRLGAPRWLAEVESIAGRSERRGAVRSMRRMGRNWEIEFDGAKATIGHSKGLADLATLLASPNKDVHVLDLMAPTTVSQSSSSVADAKALADYKRRIARLDEDIDRAAVRNDTVRGESLASEREALIAELRRSTTRTGGSRVFANYPAERARKAVAARVRDAISRLHSELPALGRHLDASVLTGIYCRYRSDSGPRWEISADS